MSDLSPQAPLVAIIEDETPIRKFLRAALVADGYRVAEAGTALAGLRLVTQSPPALILLDLGLPDRDGKELVAEIRGWSDVPIVVLSARDQEAEKVAALDLGADDYLTKPFSVNELLARMRVALRHHVRSPLAGNAAGATVYQDGPLRMDLLARRVFLDDQEVKLTKLEYDLLALLVRHAGRVLTHRTLLKEVWGPDAVRETHYVRVFVANLRKKIEPDPARPHYILTEQGVGYRFRDSGPGTHE
ncbi:MAG: response regulator [Planctomycetaceae bacterium]|nr:response regulator [Planctomycetaceae bacterium]